MSLLESLRESLQQKASLQVDRYGEYSPYELRVMVALFVLSAAHADEVLKPEEHAAMIGSLEKQLAFTHEQATRVLEVAHFFWERDHGMEEFAEKVRESFDQAQRETLLGMVLKVFEADKVVTTSELHVLNRVVELLHLPRESIDRAKAKLKQGDI